MFRAWYNAPIAMPVAGNLDAEFLRFQVTGYRHCNGCIIPRSKHSLVLLKIGETITRNMLS